MTNLTYRNVGTLCKVIDKGLSFGIGKPNPGHMCVEAAISYVFDKKARNDSPSCVHISLRHFSIALNDLSWPSNLVRSQVLKRFAIAQLGTADMSDHVIQDIIKQTFEEYKIRLWKTLREIWTIYKDAHVYRLEGERVREIVELLEQETPDFNCLAEHTSCVTGSSEPNLFTLTRGISSDISHYGSSSFASTISNMWQILYRCPQQDRVDSLIPMLTANLAEIVVQKLSEYGSPGSKWLHLAPLEEICL